MNTEPEIFYQGKVRDLYQPDIDTLILVASDRISAFDVVFPEPIPGKGEVLTAISTAWFQELRQSGLESRLDFSDHLITASIEKYPEPYCQRKEWKGRSMLVRSVKRINFECVVRGYLAGSAYKEYRESGGVLGHTLPSGLLLSSRLPEPIFTPATKEDKGSHDINVDFKRVCIDIGEDLATRLREISIAIYNHASNILESVGLILCDTKFEFGIDREGKIVLIDEILTPDSSRYWNRESYLPGKQQDGFDKQIIRDYLEGIRWNKEPPPPPLPDEIIRKTIGRYRELQKKVEKALKCTQ